MSINPSVETLLTREKAFPFLKKPPTPEVWWRWRTRGVSGVKLECIRIGSTWYTSAAAVDRFIAAQTEAAIAQPDSAVTERSEATTRRLKSAGLLTAAAH